MNRGKRMQRIVIPWLWSVGRGRKPTAEGSAPAAGRWAALSRKEKLILLLPAAAAVAVILTVILLLDRSVTCTVDGEAMQYYAGGTFPIAAKTELRRDSGGDYTMKTGRGDRQTLNDLPIYYLHRAGVLLPRDMVYFAPRTGERGRAACFSEVLQVGSTTIRLAGESGETAVEPGFLYDGGDMYLFLEPVTLHLNGYTVELPALSYVEAVYGGSVMVFDYGTKEQMTGSPRGDVTAVAAGGDYTISLLGDSVTLHNGEKSLLFTRPELLEAVGE